MKINNLKHKLKKFNRCYQLAKWVYHSSRIAWCIGMYKRRRFLQEGEADRLLAFKDIYKGKRCFIIGNGPSLRKQDLTVLKDELTFVTNWFPLYEKCDDITPNFYCVSDCEFFGEWKGGMLNQHWYSLVSENLTSAIKFFPFPLKSHIEKDQLFSTDKTFYLDFSPHYFGVHNVWKKMNLQLDITKPLLAGHTVIIDFCIPIAAYMGFSEIYLLGCDCDYGKSLSQNGQREYFYPSEKHTTGSPDAKYLASVWESGSVLKTYGYVKKRLDEQGINVFNATIGGKLEVFERVALSSLF